MEATTTMATTIKDFEELLQDNSPNEDLRFRQISETRFICYSQDNDQYYEAEIIGDEVAIYKEIISATGSAELYDIINGAAQLRFDEAIFDQFTGGVKL
jgi:hypothetical protein